MIPSPASSTSSAASAAVETTMEPQRGFNFRQFWHALLERLWIVVLCLLAGLFIALGYLARTPKSYQSHAVLEVDFQEPTMVVGEESAARMRSMFLASQEALRTIEQNLTNRSLLARVVRAENLAEDGGAAFLGGQSSSSASKAIAPAGSNATHNSNTKTEPNVVGGMTFTPLEEGLAGALSGMVRPVIRRGTRLIDLYVTNRDPVMAQRVAEAVGREYIRNAIERRASFSQESLRYMLEEQERLKADLQKSEAAVAEYKEKTPDALQLGGGAAATGSQTGAGAGVGSTRGGLVEDKLQELSAKLTAAKSDRLRLEGELKQIESAGDDVDALLSVPSIANAPLVNERRQDVAKAQAAIAPLAQRYTENNPAMIAVRADVRHAQQTLKEAVLAQPNLLRNAIEQAKRTEENLQAAVVEQEKAALALNKAAIGYQELARQAETDRALYESVIRQIKETNLTKDMKTNAVSIAEHASLPRAPVSPIPSKVITLGLLGGLAAALAFIFGADALDRSIKTVDQAEAVFGLPVLAAVPETKPSEVKRNGRRGNFSPDGAITYRLVEEAPEGPVAEAFRNLRASLSLLGPESERKVFLFTSALPSEGKSFTSVNYALALAQQGYRVLLIDGDLRRPSIHKVFVQGENGSRVRSDQMLGIVDYLIGAVELRDAARVVLTAEAEAFIDRRTRAGTESRRGELAILAGGRRAPNPAELLSGHSFNDLIAEASNLYDRVVVDSAPILAVSDTLLMVPHVQTICIVIRASRTPRNAGNRALSLLGAAGARPAGIILNRLPRRRGAGYYYYYASHGYGAGEGSYAGRYAERPTTLSTPS
jgi:polysaccharide biosynthesis transport protein